MKRNKTIIILSIMSLAVLFVLGLSPGGYATEGPPATSITGINLIDNGLEIKANRPFIYTIYKPSDPYKVVVEIPDADIRSFREVIKGSGGITEITPSQTDSPRAVAKVELLLQSPSGIDSRYHNNSLVLTVKGSDPGPSVGTKMAAMKVDDPLPSKAGAKSTGQTATEITDITFDRSPGIVKVIIKGNGSMNPSVFTLKNKIVIDIPDVSVKAAVPSSAVLPVKSVKAGKQDDKTRVVIDLDEARDFDVISAQDTVIVSLKTSGETQFAEKPVREVKEVRTEGPEAREVETLAEGRYTGQKISLDFQDSDIVPVFRLLADISGYNVVVDPNVKGKLTMKLINVPWDQALDIILKTVTPPLDKVVEGNILRISTRDALKKERDSEAAARKAAVELEPLQTRVFSISYAEVSDVEKALKDSKLLSPRGSYSVDKRTSSLTVKDIPSIFAQIETLLATIDKQTPQVMIETRIVEVSTSDEKDLGIQWGLKLSAANTLSSFTGYPNLNKGPFTGNNFLVDFPSTSAAQGAGSGFTFGILSPDRTFGLDLQLSALQKMGRTKIISNPRVVTTDNKEAMIKQGTSEPFPKLTTEGTISTEFKDVTLETTVTPHITPAGSVKMTIAVKKEDILGTVNIGGSQVPRTSKIEGKTEVLIQSGETVVIGGVYKKTETTNRSGVPWLMNVPVLGWMFKNEHPKEDVSELLIFLTPRIVEKQ